jgi:hypothetical protein
MNLIIGATTVSKMTLSLTTLSTVDLIASLSINVTQHNRTAITTLRTTNLKLGNQRAYTTLRKYHKNVFRNGTAHFLKM